MNAQNSQGMTQQQMLAQLTNPYNNSTVQAPTLALRPQSKGKPQLAPVRIEHFGKTQILSIERDEGFGQVQQVSGAFGDSTTMDEETINIMKAQQQRMAEIQQKLVFIDEEQWESMSNEDYSIQSDMFDQLLAQVQASLDSANTHYPLLNTQQELRHNL